MKIEGIPELLVLENNSTNPAQEQETLLSFLDLFLFLMANTRNQDTPLIIGESNGLDKESSQREKKKSNEENADISFLFTENQFPKGIKNEFSNYTKEEKVHKKGKIEINRYSNLFLNQTQAKVKEETEKKGNKVEVIYKENNKKIQANSSSTPKMIEFGKEEDIDIIEGVKGVNNGEKSIEINAEKEKIEFESGKDNIPIRKLSDNRKGKVEENSKDIKVNKNLDNDNIIENERITKFSETKINNDNNIQGDEYLKEFSRVEITEITNIIKKIIIKSNSQGKQEAHIKLHPPDLGHLHLSVQIDKNEVKLIFAVEHPRAAELIQQQLDDLNYQLQNLGLNLGEAQINFGTKNNNEFLNYSYIPKKLAKKQNILKIVEKNEIFTKKDRIIDLHI